MSAPFETLDEFIYQIELLGNCNYVMGGDK